jgi:hypothetical protein
MAAVVGLGGVKWCMRLAQMQRNQSMVKLLGKLVPQFEPSGREGWPAVQFRATTTNANVSLLRRWLSE